MKCMERVRKLAEGMGAVFSINENEDGMYVDAKPGYTWVCEEGLTCLCAPYRNAVGQKWAREACADLEDRMSYGLELCSAEEIERIEWERDEPWRAPEGSPERILPR